MGENSGPKLGSFPMASGLMISISQGIWAFTVDARRIKRAVVLRGFIGNVGFLGGEKQRWGQRVVLLGVDVRLRTGRSPILLN